MFSAVGITQTKQIEATWAEYGKKHFGYYQQLNLCSLAE
jgi:hypothetical protein